MKNKVSAVLTLGVFSILAMETGISGLLPMIAAEYGVSLAEAGLLISSFAVVVAISAPLSTLLFSRFDRKRVMLLSLSVFVVCNTVAAFAPTFAVLLAARAVAAFFHPLYISLALSAASEAASAHDAPKAVAVVMMGTSAGSVVGSPVARTLASAVSLRWGLLLFAVLALIALVVLLAFAPPLPAHSARSYGSQLKVLKSGGLWASILCVIIINGAVVSAYSYLPAFLEAVPRLSVGSVSLMLLLFGLLCILGNGIAGAGLTKSPNRVIIALPVGMLLIFGALLLTGASPVASSLITLVWGVMGGINGSCNQYLISSAAKEAPEFANGLFLSSANLGTALCTPVCGAVITAAGMAYLPAAGITLLILAPAALWLRKRAS